MTGQMLLDVRHLSLAVEVAGDDRVIISDVTLALDEGESLGLVGESGSGKSMTVRAILRLQGAKATVGGRVEYHGRDVYAMTAEETRAWHGSDVALIYQDPRVHINPLRTIGDFLTEAMVANRRIPRAEATRRAIDVLNQVGIPDARRRLAQYPHQLSGGLLQRVMIASALLSNPRLLIADEPTTALDVTTQEEVMAILDNLRRDRGLSMIFITHDLDLAAAVTDRLAVMYAGVIVESGPSADMQTEALHPYTAALLASRPSVDRRMDVRPIQGRPIAAWEAGQGCVFASRCPFVQQRCVEVSPPLRVVDNHTVACHRAEELRGHLFEADGDVL